MSVMLLLLMLAVTDTQDLVKKLGDDRWTVRENAHREIVKTMDFTRYLEMKSIKTKDLEVARRIENIMRGYEITLRRSAYKVDLKGYPGYPWIELQPDSLIQLKYLRAAENMGAPADGKPTWTNYRKATELWLEERVPHTLSETMKDAKNEKEFRSSMDKSMRAIQREVEAMIEKEDKYWKDSNKQNPLRMRGMER